MRTARSTRFPLHVVFAGGLTGGHLFPALAVAEQLIAESPDARISFLGPGTALERTEVSRAGYEHLTISCPRAPKGMAQVAGFGYRMLQGYRTALAYLRRQHVSIVVGLGSFGSVPAALAARRLRLPLVLLEQNAIVGRANRRLAPLANLLCLSFDDVARQRGNRSALGRCPTLVTGTPVRAAFRTVRSSAWQRPRLVVTGGSGGARLLNQSVPAALAKLGSQITDWEIIHQTGAADEASTAATYRAAGIRAVVRSFCEDLATVLAHADLAISRAGGSTLAELATMRVPPVLVPLETALDDHQRHNARAFAAAGAAVMVDDATEPVALSKYLAVALAPLVERPWRRRAMQDALRNLARPDAALRISHLIQQFTCGTDRGNCAVAPFAPDSIDAFAA
ncbi:MAG TPA: glycosyltransferase [Pirellulales bacterium]|nr:glycosyltransferase [Pirellulales bacterium]